MLPPPLPVPAAAPIAFALGGFIFAAMLVSMRRTLGSSSRPGETRDRSSVPGIMVQMLGFFVATFGPIDSSQPLTSPAAWAILASVVGFVAAALLLFRASAKALGANWSIVARTRAEHELVTSGPFARVRHPIYVAILFLLVAGGMAFGHPLQLIVGIPIYLIGTLMRVRVEEKLLRAAFGEQFETYAATVPALFPRL